LLILSTIYVLYYKEDIYQLQELNSVNLIFILWLLLLFLPLFSEMEFLGVKLKKEVNKVKIEVKEGFNNLRMEIMDMRISNCNANTVNFGDNFLATKEKLNEWSEDFATNPNDTDDNLKAKADIAVDAKGESNIDFEVTEESIYLFKVRLMLQRMLTDLCEKTEYSGRKIAPEMIKHLARYEVLNSKTMNLLSQTMRISNRGVHGEIVSKEYIEFIKKVLPEIQKQLKEADTRLRYCICPRCKYCGISEFDNVCPKCGFTSDD